MPDPGTDSAFQPPPVFSRKLPWVAPVGFRAARDWRQNFLAGGRSRMVACAFNPSLMSQELVTLECTEARKEGKPVSRYLTYRNKKTVTERIEKKKYNPHLKRHTLHKEIK